MILTYASWQEMFSGREDAVGNDVRVDGEPYTVVGVLPARFGFLEPDAKLWLPLAFSAAGREIGIRLALGSEPARIFTLVIREGLLLVVAGLLIGFGGAIAIRRALETQLFGIGALDPLVLSMVTGTLTIVALIAWRAGTACGTDRSAHCADGSVEARGYSRLPTANSQAESLR